MPPEQGWLVVSKPLRPPFRDGSTVLVRSLVAGLPERFRVSYFGDPEHPVRAVGEVIPAAPMGYAPGMIAKMRTLAAILNPARRSLPLHFFFTPNAVTSSVVAALRRLQPNRPMVQSLMSSHGAVRHVPRLRRLDAVVVLSEHTRSALVEAGLADDRVVRIYPAVDPAPEVSAVAEHRRILYAGDLDADVVERLLAIARALADTRASLCIACRPKGEGHEALRAHLQRELAESITRGRVELMGEVEDMDALLRRSSLQIFIADHLRNKVDLPLVVLEGMARGVGVLALDVAPLSEIFALGRRHGLEPGTAIDASGTHDQLAAAVARAIGRTEDLVRWGADARELVECEFSTEKMVRGYAELYDKLRGG